jgi:hypothetical protein
MRSALVFFLCGVLFVLARRAHSQETATIDAEWVARGATEGAALLKKYEDLLSYLEERSEATIESPPGGVGQTTTTHSVRLQDNAMIERGRFFSDASRQPRLSLECQNPAYHFSLGKSGKDAPYALNQYAKGERSTPVWKCTGGLHGEVFYHLKRAIEALTPEKKADLRLVRFDAASALLTLSFTLTLQDERHVQELVLAPTKGWMVISRSVEAPKMVGRYDYTYGRTIEGMHFPTGSTGVTTVKAVVPPRTTRVVVRVLDIKRTEKTPADFRLTAFGFPEPQDVAPLARPTPWHLWTLLAGAACGAFAFSLTYLRRRLRRS